MIDTSIVWMYRSVENPQNFHWDCIAQTKEELEKKTKEKYGRICSLVVAVQVKLVETPGDPA